MSTRGVMGRATGGEGEFRGVYIDGDAYPTWTGPRLWKLFHEKYHSNLSAFLRANIDKASKRIERFTHQNDIGWAEWLWIFDEENRRLIVRDHRFDTEIIVDLLGLEPDWPTIQCGEDLTRCTHYAYVHYPELKKSRSGRLGTDTYLGRQNLRFHDICGLIVKGKRYSCTGTGSLRGEVWMSWAKARNGKGVDIPAALVDYDDGYRPYPGVTWVFPPTKDNPSETFQS